MGARLTAGFRRLRCCALDETVNRRTWPGDGEFDLARFTQTLRRRGWDGLVSVEVLSDQLRDLPVATFARLVLPAASVALTVNV